jgi:hypothetical protein
MVLFMRMNRSLIAQANIKKGKVIEFLSKILKRNIYDIVYTYITIYSIA